MHLEVQPGVEIGIGGGGEQQYTHTCICSFKRLHEPGEAEQVCGLLQSRVAKDWRAGFCKGAKEPQRTYAAERKQIILAD